MNNFNLSDDKVNGLLQMASKKLGKDPETLKAQLQAGEIDALTQNLDQKSQQQINSVLGNPKAVESLMQNEAVRKLLGNLGQK